MKRVLKRVLLASAAMLFAFSVVETAFRLLDPFPYVPLWERSDTLHGGPWVYDQGIGWTGAPSWDGEIATESNRFAVRHNAQGYRDLEEAARDPRKGAIVFLGDSFTWGYQVDADDAFVELLRPEFPAFEVYNLGHCGYGTDQALLTFERWQTTRRVALVVLVFCENDFGDNVNAVRYDKGKPLFVVEDGRLVLTNVPVPRTEAPPRPPPEPPPAGLRQRVKHLLLHSHFMHALYEALATEGRDPAVAVTRTVESNRGDTAMTARLLERLNGAVTARGARLVVVAAPSKLEFVKGVRYEPYQRKLEAICTDLKIGFLDLAPALRRSILRTYLRTDMHWTAHGNAVAADAIHDLIVELLQASDGSGAG